MRIRSLIMHKLQPQLKTYSKSSPPSVSAPISLKDSKSPKTREVTPDYVYVVGESTLETLPGTITPPSIVYSPKEKLADSCISVTSTPTKNDSINSNQYSCRNAMNDLSLFLSREMQKNRNKEYSSKKRDKNVNFISSQGINIDGKGKPIRSKPSKKELQRRQIKHEKVLKNRKKMWNNYQKVKCRHHKTKNPYFNHSKVKHKIKKRSGDLI